LLLRRAHALSDAALGRCGLPPLGFFRRRIVGVDWRWRVPVLRFLPRSYDDIERAWFFFQGGIFLATFCFWRFQSLKNSISSLKEVPQAEETGFLGEVWVADEAVTRVRSGAFCLLLEGPRRLTAGGRARLLSVQRIPTGYSGKQPGGRITWIVDRGCAPLVAFWLGSISPCQGGAQLSERSLAELARHSAERFLESRRLLFLFPHIGKCPASRFLA